MSLINKEIQKEHLKARIDSFLDWSKNNQKKNMYINTFLILLGLMSSSLAGYFGLTGDAKSAGILGLVITLLISLQNAFKFNDKSIVYLNMHNEAKNLRDELYYEPNGDEHVISVSKKFMSLKSNGLDALPKDTNLDRIIKSDG